MKKYTVYQELDWCPENPITSTYRGEWSEKELREELEVCLEFNDSWAGENLTLDTVKELHIDDVIEILSEYGFEIRKN